jgi:hypothetical protein
MLGNEKEKSRKYAEPVGPLMLSIQPGMGSKRAAVTVDGLTMASGMSPCSSRSNCSAMALV